MSILKAIGPPGSLGFFAVSIAAGLVIGYVWPRKPRVGRAWLAGVLGLYLVLSWPPTAQALTWGLQAPSAAGTPAVRALDTLIVLDGDNRQGRARAAEQAVAAASPRAVHVVGSPWILDVLSDAMLRRVIHHPAPATTRAQIAWVQQLVTETEAGHTAIVVSRLQAPRVLALMAKAAPGVTLIASPLDHEPRVAGIWRLIPSYGALCASRDALYEHAALRYYRWQGWI